MVKQKFGGQKLDLKDVLAPAAAAPKSGGSSWAQGAGAAASSKGASSAPGPTKAAPMVGSWARGGPQGLAATATSIQSQPKFAPAARPSGAGAMRLGLGQKRDLGPAAPSFDSEAFPEAEKPKTAAELAEEAARVKAAKRFPEVADCAEAMAALCKNAGSTETSDILRLTASLSWLLNVGLPGALTSGDMGRLVKAGALVVEGMASEEKSAGKIQELLEAYFQDQQQKGKNTPQILEANGLVDALLFGGLAKKMEAGSPRQAAIRLRLVRRLQKPTTPPIVQHALASSLAALLAADPEAAEEVCRLFIKDLAALQESVRRGAALGAAAAVKGGGGASALKKIGVMEVVKEFAASAGKASSGKRQGGLLLLQALAEALGRTFEPYAVASMPLLLESCSDSSKEVQLAGRAAAQTVVAQVSSAGVRLMVNPVLVGLKDKRWRTQLSAAELLMPIVSELIANAPKRLAAVMPKAVPALCEAGQGARKEIRDAATEVLEKIGSAIDHPEIASMSSDLIAALMEPGDGALGKALDRLLGAVYTSTVSGASCALICPVIERALSRGDAEARKKGASFVRTLSQWALDSEELGPYLAILRPQLQALLGDPAPEVRDAAAQAIGALAAADSAATDAGGSDAKVSGGDVAATLLAKLGSGDGAELEGIAQGLAAAMATASEERCTELLNDLLQGASFGTPLAGRLGRLEALSCLPKAFRERPGSEDAVASALPVFGTALSDKDEAVRAAGRKGLNAAAEGALSSAAAAAVAEELQAQLRVSDPGARAAAAELALVLLPQRCFSAASTASSARSGLVAAGLIAQADSVANVRRAADRVWRAATEASGGNPQKQLKDLRPVLLERLVADLISGEASTAAAAGRATAQLHGRLEANKGVIEDLVPKICEALESSEVSVRRSVCTGLAEILQDEKCQKVALRDGSLVRGVKDALLGAGTCEGSDDLRAAAAAAVVAAPGASLADPILDELCGSAYNLDEEQMLGLRRLLAGHAGSASGTGSALLPALMARAAASPISLAQLACLAATAAAPAAALRRIAAAVASACVDAAGSGCEEKISLAGAAAAEIVARLDAPAADEFITGIASRIERGRAGAHSEGAARVLAAALGALTAPLAEPEGLLDILVPGCVLSEPGDESCASAFGLALQALVRLSGAAALCEEAAPRLSVALAAQSGGPGTLTPKALDAFAPLLQQGATSAGQHRRCLAEASAELCRRACADSLQAHAVKLTGPLVRSLGEKPIDVELQSALVSALLVLLQRAGATLRPLVPALQTALVRLLEGPEELHQVTAQALGAMAPLVPRAEALVKALGKPPARAANMNALAEVLRALGPGPFSAEVSREVAVALDVATQEKDTALASAASSVLRALGPGPFSAEVSREVAVALDVATQEKDTALASAASSVKILAGSA